MHEEDVTQKKYQVDSSDDQDYHAKQQITVINEKKEQPKVAGYDDILDLNLIKPRTKEKLILDLKDNGILYKEETYSETSNSFELHISKINHTKNYEIVTLTVSIGPFQQEVTILNIFKKSFMNKLVPIFYARNTNIYNFIYKEKQYICKENSFTISNDPKFNLRKQEIIQALSQYCITSIMSTLKIGAKLSKDFYFDLVVSESGVQFYLERCLSHIQKGFIQENSVSLKTALKQMHILGLLHRDIKPANIMYSNTFKKYVFIDFGVSQYRKERPGELVKSKFLGTYAYCSDQLKRLFRSKQGDYIDIYFNDVFGLKISIEQMLKSLDSESISIKNQTNKVNYIVDQIQFLQRKVKFLLYSNQSEQITSQIKIFELSKSFQTRILSFLYQIPATQSIRKFYLFQIGQDVKKQKIFQDLWQCFKTPVYFESYKGTRKFLSIEQENSSSRYHKIYSRIIDNYSNIVNDFKVMQDKFEKFLKEVKQQNVSSKVALREYQQILVDYISFKNLKWQISLKQKYNYCKKYAQLRGLNIEKQISQRQYIEEVLLQICQSYLEQEHIEHFYSVIQSIQNYFIVGKTINTNAPQFFMKFIENIFNDQKLNNLRKIRRTLSLLPARKYLIEKNVKYIEWLHAIKIQNYVQQKLRQMILEQQKKCSKHLQIFEFLLKSIVFYFIEIDSISLQEVKATKHHIGYLKNQYPELKKIFNYIEFKIGIQFERLDKIYEGRRIYEEKKNKQITKQGQINVIFFQIVRLYDVTIQIKKMSKYLFFIDKAINCKQIEDQYYLKQRIFIQMYLKDYQKAKQYFKKLSCVEVERENIFKIMSIFHWGRRMIFFHLTNIIQAPKDFFQFVKIHEDKTIRLVALFDDKKQQILFRDSNWTYLTLLSDVMMIQYGKMRQNNENIKKQNPETMYDNIWETSAFKKLMSLDRSNFTPRDHGFMILLDLIQFKKEKKFQEMLKYLTQKFNLVQLLLQSSRKNRVVNVSQCFALIIQSFLGQSNNQLIRQALQLITPILEKRDFAHFSTVDDYQFAITRALIVIEKYDIIVSQVVKNTKFFSNYVSNTNIIEIIKFYNIVIASVFGYDKQKQITLQLKKIINLISPKKYPHFALFLLFFVYPCNRHKIIKFVYKSLDYINLNGKTFILSRLYKQLLKVRYISSFRRKYLLKKDLLYPSAFKLNLADMKHKLNTMGELNKLKAEFLDKFQQKLVNLGKCCEVYSEIRAQNQLNTTFNQKHLDSSFNLSLFQKWAFQKW